MQKVPLVLVLMPTRTRKKHKKSLWYAWVAIKPDNMLSHIGKSVGKRKGGYISLSPFIGFPVEMNERKMLLSFFPISQQGTKIVPYSIQGTTYEGTTYT
jgi:hypothetical protein